MEIEEALRTYLLTQPSLVALVGTRISPLMQDAVFPAVVYFKVSDVKGHVLAGQSSLERPVFQFSCYALTKAGARAVSNLIKTALQDYAGTLSGIEIQHIKLMNEISSTEKDTQIVYVDDLEFEVNFIRS